MWQWLIVIIKTLLNSLTRSFLNLVSLSKRNFLLEVERILYNVVKRYRATRRLTLFLGKLALIYLRDIYYCFRQEVRFLSVASSQTILKYFLHRFIIWYTAKFS